MASKRINILTNAEIDALYSLPKFNIDEKQIFFALNDIERKELDTINEVEAKIYFVLQLGYFKAKQRVFLVNYNAMLNDIKFIIRKYFPQVIQNKRLFAKVNQRECHERILSLFGFKEYDQKAKKRILDHTIALTRRVIDHTAIFCELITYFTEHKIILPSYTVLQDLVTLSVSTEEKRLQNKITHELSDNLDALLAQMLTRDVSLRLNAFKKIPSDFKYGALKAEVDKGEAIKPIYIFARQFIHHLDISEYNIRYYAMVAEQYHISQLKKLKPQVAKLYLLCYIYYRYQQINDNLLICYNYYADKFDKEVKAHVTAEFMSHARTYQANIPKVSKLLRFVGDEQAEKMEHATFYREIYAILPKTDYTPTADYLEGSSFDEQRVKIDYYCKNSHRIKKYFRPILRHLDFQYENEGMPIVPVIKFLQEHIRKSKNFVDDTSDKLPIGFIPKNERAYLQYQQDGKSFYKASKYEIYACFALAKAIGNGKVYCNESIQHKSLKADLLSDELWQDKANLLQQLDYGNISVSAETKLGELKELLHDKLIRVNKRIADGENANLKQDNEGWHVTYNKLDMEESNHRFFKQLAKTSIVDVLHFVNQQTKFMDSFTHLRTKHVKQKTEIDYIIACIVANGLGFGIHLMSQTSDINPKTLVMHEQNFIRIDSLKKANDQVVNAIAKLGIYQKWQLLLLDQLLGSVDGSKYETKVQTIQSRYSPKYFGLKKGVVALNYLVNHAVVNSEVIRPNDHESHFLFDIIRNNTSEIDADAITGDMHSINCLNYVLLNAINKSFTPNYNSPQKETISCMQLLKTYNHCIVKPTKIINEKLIEDEWDNIQRILASVVMGKTTQSIIVSKLSSSKRNSKTKRALSEYNEILKSLHLLDFIDDASYRACIRKALNRVEAYHNFRRAIAKVGGGKLSGKSIVENEVWNQCTRLVANSVIFYNGLLLDNILNILEAQEQNAEHLKYIKNISPISWVHINLTGKYEFIKGRLDINMQEMVVQFKKYLDTTLLKSAMHVG